MPSDEERITTLEKDLALLRERVMGMEARAESTSTREDLEKAKSDVLRIVLGSGGVITGIIIGVVAIAVTVIIAILK